MIAGRSVVRRADPAPGPVDLPPGDGQGPWNRRGLVGEGGRRGSVSASLAGLCLRSGPMDRADGMLRRRIDGVELQGDWSGVDKVVADSRGHMNEVTGMDVRAISIEH